MEVPLIQLRNVTVLYNQGTPDEVVALSNLSLDFACGESVLVTGGNGSGKSTLLKAIAGTAPVMEGTVRIGGADVTPWPAWRRALLISFIHQDPMLGTCPNLTLHDNFCLSESKCWWSLLPVSPMLDWISRQGALLADKATSSVNNLSGGQRQLAAVLMAAASRKQILLLDEFTSALDEARASACLSLVSEKIRRQRLTTIAVLHHFREKDFAGFRRIHLEGGSVRI